MAAELKIGIILVLLALFCGENYWVFEQGKAVERAAMVEASSKGKDLVIDAIVKNDAENTKTEAKQDQISREVSHETQDELISVRDFKPAPISLRITIPPAAFSIEAAPGEEAAGSCRPDADVAATVVLPEEVARELQADSKYADEIVTKYRGLQAWVTKQGFYGPGDQSTDADLKDGSEP